MLATSATEKRENFFETGCLPKKNNKLLKSAAVYGPNAAGKTNFITAIIALEQLVLTSHRNQVEEKLRPIVPFKLDEFSASEPTSFEIVFLKNDKRFLYTLRVDTVKVHDECLYVWENNRKKALFERHNTVDFVFPGSTHKTEKDKAKEEVYLEQTLENILFLSQATKLKNSEVTDAYKWFLENCRKISSKHNSSGFTANRVLQDENFKKRLQKYIITADLGIDDIQVNEEELEKPPYLDEVVNLIGKHSKVSPEDLNSAFNFPAKVTETRTIHSYVDSNNNTKLVDFELSWESEGTQKFYCLLGPIDQVLEKGYTLFIDELDVHLHPKLARKIVELFNCTETNPKNAQLICSTHNTNLLDQDLFRRDQVWFVDKNRNTKSSEVYALSEFNNIRKDLKLEKSYLQGRFGAVPLLDDWV